LENEEMPVTSVAAEIDPQKAKDLAAKMLKANPEILQALTSPKNKEKLENFVAGAEKLSEMPPEEIEAETENVVSEAEDYITDKDATIEFLGYLSAGGASITMALAQLYNASPEGMKRLVDQSISPGLDPSSTGSKAFAIAALAAGIGLLGTAGIKALGLDGRARINPRDYGKNRYSSWEEEDEGISESRRRTLRRR
jgi:hypothetical protein